MMNDILAISNAPPSWRLKPIVARLVAALRAGKFVSKHSVVVLSVSCVSSRQMAKLNADYRGKNLPTDVLSFEQDSGKIPGVNFLGDLVVCTDVTKAQAKAQKHGVQAEATILVAHGLLHLLGYDHERSKAEHVKMAKAEAKLLRLAGFRQKPGLVSRDSIKIGS